MTDTKQEWQYHDVKPVKGRKLRLLEETDLVTALPLIFRLIPKAEVAQRKEWFVHFETEQEFQSQFSALTEKLSVVTKNRRDDKNIRADLLEVNRALNCYFSDYGWRMVRKELSQIKKRKKKSHIEVSNDLIHRLKAFMSLKQLDSFDQALDYLLSEAEQGDD
ncbi:hypothetical protein JK628_11720 [Shewanella sp. KX20019]|uniref:hypothetical protein n=1 Tax=Shewanella sp. KX20019 TaxID=2803864 RepID=UPI001927F4C4|nr:hypothetical protein [Shewanella sp. KX20019]QQX82536.1 hypothetical protein JK628_11720 [Shewanella sp. KX20019]